MRTPAQQVNSAVEILTNALRPIVEKRLLAMDGKEWVSKARDVVYRHQPVLMSKPGIHLDCAALLTLMSRRWDDLFASSLGRRERSFVEELREIRNDAAHQHAMTDADAHRAIDTAIRLLRSLGAEQAVAELSALAEAPAPAAKPTATSSASSPAVRASQTVVQRPGRASKYSPLHDRLKNSGQARAELDFKEIDSLVGKLPQSAREHQAWWGNHLHENRNPQARAWMTAGYRVHHADLVAQRVVFVRG